MALADSSIYFYDPSLAAATAVCIIYAIPTFILSWQTVFKYKTMYLLGLPIGGIFEIAGYAARACSVKNVRDIVRHSYQLTLIPIQLAK
jgi:hypothetical protein